jgi:hypothetical protein
MESNIKLFKNEYLFCLTKHCKQRREHFKIRPNEEMFSILKFFESKVDFSSLEYSKYKIRFKHSNVAVFKVTKSKNKRTSKPLKKITLITCRGFELDKLDSMEYLNINKQTDDNLFIYRTNFKGKLVKCGRFSKLEPVFNVCSSCNGTGILYNVKYNKEMSCRKCKRTGIVVENRSILSPGMWNKYELEDLLDKEKYSKMDLEKLLTYDISSRKYIFDIDQNIRRKRNTKLNKLIEEIA